MQQSQEIKTGKAIHPGTDVGTVTLKVADLRRSLAFYSGVIGLKSLYQEGRTAALGANGRTILYLEEVPGARPQPLGTTGLYHAAILFPDRHSLAVKIAQLAEINYPYGYSDHLVSEAFYISDPDGNGLELYRDRPRQEWMWVDNQVRMALDPIDFDNFFAEIKPGDPAMRDSAAPDGTKLGHVHLRVADLARAEKFYVGALGFEITARMPGALFVSAGHYHHHLGMNTWESLGGHQPEEPSAGLREFSIVVPDRAELERLQKQIGAAGIAVERGADSILVRDPFENMVKIVNGEK